MVDISEDDLEFLLGMTRILFLDGMVNTAIEDFDRYIGLEKKYGRKKS